MEPAKAGTTLDFQALFESAPGLYLVLDPDFTIVAVSEAYLRATMTRREQIMRRGLFEVFPDNPDDPAADGVSNLRASLNRVLQFRKADTMAVQKYDIRRPESEGGGFEERFWSPVNSPVLDSAGNLTHIIHRVEDVTDFVRLKSVQAEKDRQTHELRQRALEMESEIFLRAKELAEAKYATEILRQSEARLRELADAMPQIVWAARPDGRIDYFNRRWYEFTGHSHVAAEKINLNALIFPDDLPRTDELWNRSVRSGEPFEIEYRLKHNGGWRWFLARALPVRDQSGQIVRWYGSSTDIDDWKRAEKELHHARDAAEAANRAKDQFLAILSHELRTPLTPVLLTVSLLENNRQLTEEMHHDVQTIRRNVELEARLIDDLLDLTRIARGKLQLHFESADVHVSLHSALEICCSDRMSDITVDLSAKRHHVRGDPARLQQIFWNLLSNAAKFTPPGKPISIRSSDNNGSIQFEISDQGVGIEPAVLPRLFRAFEQGDSSLTRTFGGLGLGLSIAKALLDAHGGKISVFSAGAGQGASFTVQLPTISTPANRPTRRPPHGEPLQASKRILLVEDHPGTLAQMTKLLRYLGHEVTTAATVKDALDLADRGEIDLVISDLGLPDGSGHDMMRALKSRGSVKGIAVSGFGMEEDIRKSLEAGFAEHLTKPIDLETLEAAIRQAAR